MSQLTLFAAPSTAADGNNPPDDRHPWARRSLFDNPPIEWRCAVCGELAWVSLFTGKWIFFRPQLATKPRGPWHWAYESHVCEPRVWQ